MASNETRTDNGSPERIALDLLNLISARFGGAETKDAMLDLYAECLWATNGRRVPK